MSSPVPFTLLQNATFPLFFGIDVGGTSIKIGLVDSNGNSIDLKEFDESGTPQAVANIKTERNPEVATAATAQELHRLIEKHKLNTKDFGGIGLGIPGTLDKKTDRLRRLPNLAEWEHFQVCIELAKKIGIPVVFCNDANAAAYGEYWVGSAKNYSSVAVLTMGTGIGCGIIIDGRSVDGSIGYGGECGHIIVDISDDAKICGCGKRGHLEIYASATGVSRRTIEITDRKYSSLRNRIHPETRLKDIPKMVCEEAELGDEVAMEIIREAARYLGIGIVSILNTLDPACVLIGGAMTFGGKGSPMGEKYIAWTREEIDKRSFPAIAKELTLDFATLGGAAGYIGAAGIAKSVL